MQGDVYASDLKLANAQNEDVKFVLQMDSLYDCFFSFLYMGSKRNGDLSKQGVFVKHHSGQGPDTK